MAEIEVRVSELERNVDRVMTKLDMFIEESRAARERQDADMREARQKHDADMKEMREKHDADMKEIRERQEAAQAKHDADMKEMQKNIYAKMDNMDTKIDGMGKHVRNMSIVAIIGIAAMVVAVFLK